jgi:hypothetical protein
MESSCLQLNGASHTKGVSLSGLSIPDSFTDPVLPKGKDTTPESKKGPGKGKFLHPEDVVNLDSTPGSEPEIITERDGERSRNLSDVFEGMVARTDSPTIGSRMAS